ncbi:molybdopterin-synthase adenylyltransferase MoeB, partial [Vibrio parahaemolyticus]|nr:molybdopterin-synthase adenylyltransferase MoeB [Vibrio parahaemolyticus]NMS47826.1 molybdopterin-synthase adenylyltransferase MoeB [Vibrio parahaemolyticus]
VAGPAGGTLGNHQAIAAIQNLATGNFHVEAAKLQLFDGLNLQWQTMAISKDKQCQVCAQI